MNLKDYREKPDAGIYEKIERRLRLRRLLRFGSAAAVVAVAAVLCVLLWPAAPKSEPVNSPQVAQLQPSLSSDTSVPEEKAVNATVPTAEEATPAVGPATMTTTLAMEETDVRTNKAEAEGNMTDLVPSYTHETTPLTLPSEPQQEMKWISPNDGVAIVESEPSVERSEPVASADPQTAVKSGEPTLHADNQMWVPNVIVPDGDIDDNRVFKMHFTSSVTDFHIYIFNRGGRQLFTSTDPSFAWDGTHNGTRLPQGAYVWVAQFRDSSGKPHQEQGTVTILR